MSKLHGTMPMMEMYMRRMCMMCGAVSSWGFQIDG